MPSNMEAARSWLPIVASVTLAMQSVVWLLMESFASWYLESETRFLRLIDHAVVRCARIIIADLA